MLVLLACASPEPIPDTAAAGFDYSGHVFERFETTLVDGFLCPDAYDPEGAADVQHIDCAIEGENERDPGDAPDEIVVMAYNAERGQRLDEQLAAFGTTVPVPDVLLLSEADRGCSRSGGANVTQAYAERLGMNWAYAVEFVELPRDSGGGGIDETCEHGNAVLSRYPLGNVSQIRHAENLSWYIPPEERDGGGQPRLGGRIAVAADLAIGDRYVHVVVVHFESELSAFDIQAAQAVETAEHAAAQPYGVVVGGDTNAPYYTFDLATDTQNDETIAAFTDRGFEDAHASLDLEDRGTAGALIIDLVLGRDVDLSDPEICEVEVCGELSDHLPLWATAGLR